MATEEMSIAGAKGDQEEKLALPEEDAPTVLNETSAPMNFSQLTPCQFGISIQSFTPASTSNRKDKSRLAQIKSRRRSSVGVRGSPETNSLIRFMAQERMKTPPASQISELIRSSPFLPRVPSTLRQKMASFQSLMDVEESDACDPMPAQDSNTGGCIKTRDYLSDGNSRGGGKENNPPTTPTPSKRRRLVPLDGCSVEIREASAPILHSSLKEPEVEEEPAMEAVTQGPRPSSGTVEEAQAVVLSPPLHVNFAHMACSPSEDHQVGVFELQTPSRPLPDDPAAASPPELSSPFHMPSLPSLLEMKLTGEDDSTGTSAVKKKKRVRFGGPLSPEFFDKTLPPSTPLQKGATPARAPTPGGGLQLRSLLKTPQRSESKTPKSQPDDSSPFVFGASPTLALPRNSRLRSEGEESEENDGKIVFPTMEEIGSTLTTDSECMWAAQPLNLNAAFCEESLCETVTESDTKPSTAQMDVPDEPTSLPENEKQPEADVEDPAPARSNSRRKKTGPKQEVTSEAPARSTSRKRKQPEESEPVKRSTRSAAKTASGKMKENAAATRRWNKEVDRSLYGSRAYASKNPALSPITERLSFISQSPAAQQTSSLSSTETHLNPEMASDTHASCDIGVTNASENSVTSRKERAAEKSRRLSGPRVRGRRQKRSKVSVAGSDRVSEEAEDQMGAMTEEHREDQTTTNQEASREPPSTHTVHEEEEADTEGLCAQTPTDALCTHSDGASECHGIQHVTTSDCPPPAEESSNTEPAQRKAKQGRRSSVNSSVLQDHAEEHQTSREVEEKGQVNQAASQQENIQSASDSQEEEEGVDLAPWQADFNFEDVFKPVATRGQRSVRRSLRNQSNTEHSSSSAGLAWLPRTSPDSTKEARRKTRGRRLSAALPAQPSLPEETQDAS